MGIDPELLREAGEAFGGLLTPHLDHPWYVIKGCVYCGPCGARLYRGRLPAGHPVFKPPPSRSQTASDAMRARWGKDA